MEETLSKAERTRRFIIERTADIFNRKGFAGTSLSDLTKATGLTKGSIYSNFENKEEVALAVFDYNYDKVVKAVEKRMLQENTYFDKLMVYARMYEYFSRSSFLPGGCPILNTAIEADDTHELLKARAADAIIKWKKNLERLIRAGISAGEFRPGLDQSQLALSIIALIEGGIMIAKVTGGRGNLSKILKTVETLLKQHKPSDRVLMRGRKKNG